MKLVPLYRLRFHYTKGWKVGLASPEGPEARHFHLAEGTCEGRIHGSFRGANHPRRRGDGTFEPDFQGIIETADGAVIFHDCRGYGRTYPVGRRQIVVSATHLSDDARYKWLNDSVAVGEGEVRVLASGQVELVIDWFEAVWESIAD